MPVVETAMAAMQRADLRIQMRTPGEPLDRKL
jgi:hypothetical protein